MQRNLLWQPFKGHFRHNENEPIIDIIADSVNAKVNQGFNLQIIASFIIVYITLLGSKFLMHTWLLFYLHKGLASICDAWRL